MDKRKFLDIILKCAHQYDINLNGQNLLFIVQRKDKRLSHIEAKFESANYMHLTGVTSNLSVNEFYRSCIDNKLSLEQFDIKNPTTGLKLQVLNEAMMIDKTAKMCGEYNNSGFNLYTEKLVGNISVCLGLVKDKHSDYYVPNTVLKEDIRNKALSPVSKIVCTFKKEKGEEKYNQLCFTGRNISISELDFSSEINEKLSDEIKERLRIPFERKEEITTHSGNKEELLNHCKEVIRTTNAILNENPELKRQFIEAKKKYLQKQENLGKEKPISPENKPKHRR